MEDIYIFVRDIKICRVLDAPYKRLELACYR